MYWQWSWSSTIRSSSCTTDDVPLKSTGLSVVENRFGSSFAATGAGESISKTGCEAPKEEDFSTKITNAAAFAIHNSQDTTVNEVEGASGLVLNDVTIKPGGMFQMPKGIPGIPGGMARIVWMEDMPNVMQNDAKETPDLENVDGQMHC